MSRTKRAKDKLESTKGTTQENSSSPIKDSSDSVETSFIVDATEAEEDTTDLFTESLSPLPCEEPILNSWGVAVFGKEFDPSGKERSASTSVNRIEFPDLSSTLELTSDLVQPSTMVMDEGQYTGYKLNCHKKKKKVEGLLELYDKDSVNNVSDKEICEQTLAKIQTAASDAVEYMDDIICQLEISQEDARVGELTAIKKGMIDKVKQHAIEVRAEMHRIIQANTQPAAPAGITALDIQQIIAGLNLGGQGQTSQRTSPDNVSKLTLRYNHIMEDANDFQKEIAVVKLATELADPEVIYYMRESKTWKKKVDELVAANRKFQEDALGITDLDQMGKELDDKVKIMKTVKDNKVAAITKVDQERNLNSLSDNKNKGTVVFPEPFRGTYGENVFKFKEDITAAIKDSQVKTADQVKTLLKYLKGEAKARVGDNQPNLEKALQVLTDFYGNVNMIWLKCREDFKQSFSGNATSNWGELGSTQRVDAIAKVMGFIRQAKQYAEDYEELKDEIMSSNTVILLTKSMPMDYLEMVYLAMEDKKATPQQKIEKMEEILGKLKDCGIMAVNELLGEDVTSSGAVVERKIRNRHSDNSGKLNPLNLSEGTACSIDPKHRCHRSPTCEPGWGLLGCSELYKLQTVEERVEYCKQSNCCFICGTANMSKDEAANERHKRCDYRAPVDKSHTRCTCTWSNRSNPSRKIPCYYGSALCPNHQSQKNTSQKLLDWLKDKKVRHNMFAINKTKVKADSKHKCEVKTDKEVVEILREQMEKSDFEEGEIADIPEGENMFMFFLLQGKEGTEPMQVFSDTGANLWFAVESVTKKLVSVQTYKGSLPINVAGGQVINATGEWAAALPMADGTYQGVRGLTMKNVVGQMPRFSLSRTLKDLKAQYKQNNALQELKIPPVLGGEIDMILGSKYLKIYPEPVQVTPSGLTISVSKLRSPGGMKSAVISGPVKLINQIFESKYAREAIESMKGMLSTVSTYKPTLEYFPKPNHIAELYDEDIPGLKDLHKSKKNSDINLKYTVTSQNSDINLKYSVTSQNSDITFNKPDTSQNSDTVLKNSDMNQNSDRNLKNSDISLIQMNSQSHVTTTSIDAQVCSVCGVTVQGELQRFMELQEAGLKTDFRCKKCRNCEDCKRGAGHERLSMKQEAEQQLIEESITVNKEEGFAIAKLPFTLNPEENLKGNRGMALGMLNSVLKKYCKDPEKRKIIYKGWEKMIDKKHLLFIEELSLEHQKMLENAKVSYWIPWNLQFKDSLSTPIRPVFNASSATHSGLSLNDCLAKGTPDLVKLLSVMLDWQMGVSAICGDISQFYPTIKLVPEHWQYQRILLRENLDPDGKLLEAVLVKLGFGIQSVSAQSEETVRRIAVELWDSFPKVALLLLYRRYVDDLAKSTNSREESTKLIQETSKILEEKLKMSIKGWSISGENPPTDVSKDGVSVDLGGHTWYPAADLFTLNLHPLCFQKKKRGKLPDGAVFYDPKTMRLEKFVPNPLTRRMVTSTIAKLWDLLGKLTPVTLKFKHDLRRLTAESPEWDSSISSPARQLWIQNFETIEKIRGLVYRRCSRPDDAVRSTCRLWILVDAAEWGMIVSVYVGWEKQDGSYSCSHLYGKGILGPEALTLPQKELHILSVGADIKELLSVMLEEWIEEILVAGDSEIVLCWAAYETVKLNQYNRVRVVNITSKLNLDNLYHIKGTENPADIGTRMKLVTAEDVFPNSDYICGKDWMKLSKEDAIKSGVIKPIEDIKLGHEQKKVMRKGIVFDSFEKDSDDIIAVLLPARVDPKKVAERDVETNYYFSPLLRNFLSFVNITAKVMKALKFLQNKLWNMPLQNPKPEKKIPKFSILSFYSDKMFKSPDLAVTDLERDDALEYIFKVETKLVKKFNTKVKLDKIAIEEDDILYSRSRVLEGQTVKVVGGLKIDTSLSGLFNLNFKVPLIDQHSPLAYPLALHLHTQFNHRGVETCHRLALNFVKIIGSLQIFKSISLKCAICLKDRKKYLRMVMGGLSDSQLTISPVFYFTMVDMWGPLRAYCPGYGRKTRRDRPYEVYFLVFSCVATGAVNVQLVEGKSTEFVLEGCSRFFNETSVPKILYPDDDGALVKAFREGEIDIEDLSGNLFKSKGILFETCSPQSHSSHGRVERVIRSLQDSFNRSGASSSRCTATGWQTMGKAMEREVNNTPIGFLYDQSMVDGNPLLRVLRPSTLKGLNSSDRAPRGLFSIPDLPNDKNQHFSKVEEMYNLWYQCWATAYIPVIMERQKWTEEDPSLAKNDIVYFKLTDKSMKAEWKLGKVDSIKVGRDGKVREVNIAYKILRDDGWTHSVVTRPTRQIIKLFEIGDTTFADEMKAVHKAAKEILMKRGALIDDKNQIDQWPGLDNNAEADDVVQEETDEHERTQEDHELDAEDLHVNTRHTSTDSPTNFFYHGDLCLGDSRKPCQPFFSCNSAGAWYQMGEREVSEDGADRKEVLNNEENEELLFLV